MLPGVVLRCALAQHGGGTLSGGRRADEIVQSARCVSGRFVWCA